MTGRRKYRDNAVTKKGGRLIAVGGLLVTSAGVVGAASLPAGAQTTSSSATNFSGAAIGNLLSIDALNIPGTLNLANAQIAPALAEVNSAGGIMAGTGTPSAGVTGGTGATSTTAGGGTGATSGNFTSHGHATNLNANVLSSGTGTGLGGLTGILGGGTGGTSLGSLSNLLGMGGTSGGGILGGILGGATGGATGTATGSSAGNMCVSNQNGGISLNNLVVCADQTAPPDNLNPVINTLLPLSSSGTPITSGTGSLGSGLLSGLLGGGLAGSGGTGSAILAGNAVTACALAHDPNLPSTSGTGTGATGTHCLNAPGLGTSTTTGGTGGTTTGGTGGTTSPTTSPTTCPTTNANGSSGSVNLPASTNAGIQARSTTSLADIVLGSGTGLGGLLSGLESLAPGAPAGTSPTAGLLGLTGLSIRIVSPNTLCATALGVPGGASVTFTPAVVQIVQGANSSGSGGTVLSTLSASNPSTSGLTGGLLGSTGLLNINLGMPVNVKTAADGTSASAQSSLLTISIGLGSLLSSTGGASGVTGGGAAGIPIIGNLISGGGGAGSGVLGGLGLAFNTASGGPSLTPTATVGGVPVPVTIPGVTIPGATTTTAAPGGTTTTAAPGGTTTTTLPGGVTVPSIPGVTIPGGTTTPPATIPPGGAGTPTTGTQLLNIQVAPMAVAANAPVGGINCATANCNPGGGGISPAAAGTLTSPVNPLAQGRNSVADASVLSNLLSLPGTSSTDSIVQLVNTPVAGTTTPPGITPTPGAGVGSPTGPSAAGPGGNGNAGNGGTLPFTGEHPWIPIAAGGLLGAGLLGVGIRRRMAHSS